MQQLYRVWRPGAFPILLGTVQAGNFVEAISQAQRIHGQGVDVYLPPSWRFGHLDREPRGMPQLRDRTSPAPMVSSSPDPPPQRPARPQ